MNSVYLNFNVPHLIFLFGFFFFHFLPVGSDRSELFYFILEK